MILNDLDKKKLIHPPDWLTANCHYLTAMGSISYGTSQEDSDFDIYGFCVPKRDMIFTWLRGEIPGFGRQKKRFEQWQESHIKDPDALGGKGREYDFTVFSIVRYFHLCMENNPNCLDSLFPPQDCILHITKVGNLVRENRKIFLSKACWAKFKGFSYSMLHKAITKNPEGKRKEIREKYGMDVKYLMNVVRLLYEAEMILTEGDLDLRRHSEHLKAIRRGEIPEKEIRKWASEKEKHLEKLYEESKLPWGPDEEKIKKLLLSCLEMQYGNLDKVIVNPDKNTHILRQIKELIETANI